LEYLVQGHKWAYVKGGSVASSEIVHFRSDGYFNFLNQYTGRWSMAGGGRVQFSYDSFSYYGEIMYDYSTKRQSLTVRSSDTNVKGFDLLPLRYEL